MAASNIFEKKIYYHDTDCGNVVYYANYLKYLEEARSDFFEKKGVILADINTRGIWFVVARIEMNYIVPAQYGNTLRITTEIEKIKSASMLFTHTIKRASTILNESKAVLVCIGDDFKPRVIPDDIRTAFTA